MTIQDDASEILKFVYDEYVKNNVHITPKDLLNKFQWDGARINRAIKYLKDIGAIDIIFSMGNEHGLQNFIMQGLTPQGIQMVES